MEIDITFNSGFAAYLLKEMEIVDEAMNIISSNSLNSTTMGERVPGEKNSGFFRLDYCNGYVYKRI